MELLLPPVLIAIVILTVWSGVKVLNKAGLSGWWVVLSLLPILNLIAVWLFAFADWPNVRSWARGQDGGRPPSGWDKPRDEPPGPPPPDTPSRIPTSHTRSPAERLAELDRLQDQGLITPEEHAQKRQEILDEM